MCKSLRFALFSVLVVAMCAFSAMAQSTTTGAIGGVVTNPAGEVVPGAAITARNLGTNKEDSAVSDDQGRFRVVNLDPGTYMVTVNASGFSPFTVDKLIVEVGLVTNVEAGVTIGPVSEKVTITSEAPVINTSQPDFTSNMNQTSINNLPINGQRWSNFALLNPGTVPDANFGLISFRGISGLLNNNTIDGGDNNQAFFSEEKGRTRLSYTTSPSSIREFQVNTSNYSAEYGRAAGGVVNAVTKSGTNQFHGDAFYYRRDNKWGARNPLGFISTFNPANGTFTRPPFKPVDVRNRWGITVGGPIVKDKLFWIFTYDEQRRNFPGLAIYSSGNYVTNINRSQLNGKGITNAQIDNVVSFLNTLTGPVPRHGNQRILFPKVDWNINSNHTLTFGYNRLKWVSPAGIQTQATNTRGRRSFGDDFVNGDTYQARLSSSFGASMTNEARFQYGRDNEFQNSQVPLPGEPLTSQAYPGVNAAFTRTPQIALSSGNGLDFGSPNFLERVAFPDEKRYQFADTVSMTIGSHTFKFGGDVNHVSDLQNNLFQNYGAYVYNNINDFIIDYFNFTNPGVLPASVQCSTNPSATRNRGTCYTSDFGQGFGPTRFKFSTQDYNFFFQDDWRYTARLTVNWGMRWEYERLPKPILGNSLVPKTTVMPADKNNFGPRVGFAWDMSGDGKNSLRGGYGLYFGRIINSTILNALINTGNAGGQSQSSLAATLADCTSSAPATPCAPVFPLTLTAAPPGGTAIQFFQTGFQAPAIHSMDLVYEREIGRNTVAQVALLMSFGRRLPTFVDTNLNPPTSTFTYNIIDGPFSGQTYTVPLFTGARPDTRYVQKTEIRSLVSSSYYGFVAQLNRRLTKGLQFSFNYTNSKARDDGQFSQTNTANNAPFNAFDPLAERGISNFDIPNKFIADAVWNPHFNVDGAASAILNGWQLSPIVSIYSGVPFTPAISGNNPVSACTASSTPSSFCRTTTGQNGSAGFARFALAPRNSFRLPPIKNFDLRLSRRFHFTESTALEFLVEGFNVFNRTQVTGLNTNLYKVQGTNQLCGTTCTSSPFVGDSAFRATNAAGGTLFRERQIQMAVRFQF